MKKQILTIILVFFLLTNCITAQPFADIATFNYQTFSAPYKGLDSKKNKTDNYMLNFFLPKEFKNGNVLLIRLNSEYIYSSIVPSAGYAIGSVSLPLGFQVVTKNKKWKTVLIAVP